MGNNYPGDKNFVRLIVDAALTKDTEIDDFFKHLGIKEDTP